MAEGGKPKKKWYKSWWFRIPCGIVGLILLASVLTRETITSLEDATCEQLAPQIIDLSEKKTSPFNPAILKLYEIKTIPNTGERFLTCTAKAKMAQGGDHQMVFHASKDADGDFFIGYEGAK